MSCLTLVSRLALAAVLGVVAVLAVANASLAGEPRVVRGLAMPSATLGRPIPYAIYLPQGHREAGRRDNTVRRPSRFRSNAEAPRVLYLLHGHGDNESAWIQLGRIKATLDRLIARGRIAPMVVVMPAAGNSWYVNDARGRRGFGPVATALTTDFVKGVEARHFPGGSLCREQRAIAGLSMGGFGAVLYAFERPDTFSAAISLSGSLFLHNLAEDRGRRRRLAQLFGGVYGVPFSITRFNAWTVFARLDKVAGLPRPPAVWLSAGDDDFPAIVDGTVRLHLALRRRGVVTQLRIDDAGHTWAYWRKAIVPALEWLSPRLEGRCDVVAGDR